MKYFILFVMFLLTSCISQDYVQRKVDAPERTQCFVETSLDSTTAPICPVCGDTATWPNQPLMAGSNDRYDGDAGWFPNVELFVCDKCGCVFVRKLNHKYPVLNRRDKCK